MRFSLDLHGFDLLSFFVVLSSIGSGGARQSVSPHPSYFLFWHQFNLAIFFSPPAGNPCTATSSFALVSCCQILSSPTHCSPEARHLRSIRDRTLMQNFHPGLNPYHSFCPPLRTTSFVHPLCSLCSFHLVIALCLLTRCMPFPEPARPKTSMPQNLYVEVTHNCPLLPLQTVYLCSGTFSFPAGYDSAPEMHAPHQHES